MILDAIIDLSHWNPNVNFARVKAAGVAAVILKATQGSGAVDPTFVSRAHAALSAGLLLGAYHFADRGSVVGQADLFLRVAGAVAPVLAVDLEPNPSEGGTVTAEIAAGIASLVQAATNRAPLIYCGRYGPNGAGAGLPNAVLSRCPLWLPEYGLTPMSPPGWTAWAMWQYTNTGSVDGVDGDVDRSRFNGDLAALTAWWSR